MSMARTALALVVGFLLTPQVWAEEAVVDVEDTQHVEELFGEEGIAMDFSIANDQLLMVKAQFHQAVKELAHLDMPEPPSAQGDKAKCKACIMGAAKWLVGAAKKHIDEWCGGESIEGGDDKKRMFCRFWKEKPKVALGLVVENMRPLQDGMFFCAGHGECGKHQQLHDVMLTDETYHFVEQMEFPIETGVCPVLKEFAVENVLYEHPSEEYGDLDLKLPHPHKPRREMPHPVAREVAPRAWSVFNLFRGEEPPPPPPHHPEEPDDDDDKHAMVPPMKGIDKKCFAKTMKFTMMVAIRMTMGMCKKTKCPFLRKWCKWARSHREMALGILLGKVEPWKYAIGRCWHKGLGHGHCNHPSHGGHHPHGHDGHHHGHHGCHHHHHGHHHHGDGPDHPPHDRPDGPPHGPPHGGPDGPPPPPPHDGPDHHPPHDGPGPHHPPHHRRPHHGDHDGEPEEGAPKPAHISFEEMADQWFVSFKTGGDPKKDFAEKFQLKKGEIQGEFATVGEKSGRNEYKTVQDRVPSLVHKTAPQIKAFLLPNGDLKWTHGYTSRCVTCKKQAAAFMAQKAEIETQSEFFI